VGSWKFQKKIQLISPNIFRCEYLHETNAPRVLTKVHRLHTRPGDLPDRISTRQPEHKAAGGRRLPLLIRRQIHRSELQQAGVSAARHIRGLHLNADTSAPEQPAEGHRHVGV
jgi:hypothetical protein